MAVLAVVAATVAFWSGNKEAPSLVDTAKKTKKLTIGVLPDQPGLGQRVGEKTYAGLDVDVATYIAKQLGVPAAGITFVPVTGADRAVALANGKAQLVIAASPVQEEKRGGVALSDPYLTMHDDVMVLSTNKKMRQSRDVVGKKLCVLPGSVIPAGLKAKAMPTKSISECLLALLRGKVVGAFGKDAVLAGYAQQNPGRFKLLGPNGTATSYSIYLPAKDPRVKHKVDSVLQKMVQDGTWKRMVTTRLPMLSTSQAAVHP
ncbi:transporter substrate-binding domain-containing protein [Actinomadura rubteroloni]|uniref:transporter substrate-binding domain-containing protein n=1 Tax=Actinomadura rubteroloni TaxID=1926885 RepID=UPI00143D2539|nr:transporter substrate-binding domain-containing protein [Actinomadura rubteroloni]